MCATMRRAAHIPAAKSTSAPSGVQRVAGDAPSPNHVARPAFVRRLRSVTDTLPMEVLATGTYRTVAGNPFTLTTEHLDEAVANFSKLQAHVKPPIKLGHGEQQFVAQPNGQPALGWIAGLERRGDKVVAHVADMPKALRTMIAQRRYRRVSPELSLAFQRSDYEKNLKSGVSGVVIEGVSLLGADIPQIPNLADLDALASFLGSQEPLHLAQSAAPGDPADTLHVDEDSPAPRSSADSPAMPTDKEAAMAEQKQTTEEIAALSQRLVTMEAELKARDDADKATADDRAKLAKTVDEQKAELARLRTENDENRKTAQVALEKQRSSDAVAFAESLCREGNMRILPAQKPWAAALHRHLASQGDTVALAGVEAERMHCAKTGEGTDLTATQLLEGFLSAAPDHSALLTTMPRKTVTGAAALDGHDYEAALAYVAGEEKLSLSVPAERSKAAIKLVEMRPQFRNARVAS